MLNKYKSLIVFSLLILLSGCATEPLDEGDSIYECLTEVAEVDSITEEFESYTEAETDAKAIEELTAEDTQESPPVVAQPQQTQPQSDVFTTILKTKKGNFALKCFSGGNICYREE